MPTYATKYPAGRYAMGQRIRAVRLSQGLTQMELGLRAGLSGGMICLLEQGRHRTTYLAEICQVLDISAQWLSLGIGRPPLFANRELRQVVYSVEQERPVMRGGSSRIRSAAAEAQRIWAKQGKQGAARSWWRQKVTANRHKGKVAPKLRAVA